MKTDESELFFPSHIAQMLKEKNCVFYPICHIYDKCNNITLKQFLSIKITYRSCGLLRLGNAIDFGSQGFYFLSLAERMHFFQMI